MKHGEWRAAVWLAALCYAAAVRADPPPPSAATPPSAAAEKATEPGATKGARTHSANTAQNAGAGRSKSEGKSAGAPKTAKKAPRASGSAPTAHAARAQPTSQKALPPTASGAAVARVEVPSTAHAHVVVPTGLQRWLDADDRMRPWLSKAIEAVDACYADVRAGDASAAGTAVLSVTMHANARPSADVEALPGSLLPMELCVTAKLIGVRMPLFTGDEGATYSVQVQLAP